MSFSHILYQLLIGPLELIFEVIYGLARNITDSCGLSVIALSLAMNVLLLPLYRRADMIQAEERATEQKLEPWVKHIKKTFKGDERFMMLQTFYRQNHYKPVYALKGSLPLLLEVPFFIAAYHFLSNLADLRGMPFGPIENLGLPDTLLSVAGVSIHVLPIIMTLINCVSSAIYTKGLPVKDKVQLYGMALIFLVLLYKSPSGLVFYWTLNNLFSLFKNLFYKIREPQKILRVLLSVSSLFLLIYCLGFYQTDRWRRKALIIGIVILMQIPVLLRFFQNRLDRVSSRFDKEGNPKMFICGCLFLAILTGLLIPSSVVRSSPAEFVHITGFYSPLRHVLNASLLSFGFFVIWLGIFYYMANRKTRWFFDFFIWLGAGIAIVDYMFFGKNLGTLSWTLKYILDPSFSHRETLVNLAVIILLALVLAVIFLKKRRFAFGACIVLSIAVLGMSVINMGRIQAQVPELRHAAEISQADEKANFRLSRQGKNVVIIMLDRAISSYIPYLFQEKPELEQQFEGFTYYPNTISFGDTTNVGVPAIFGGYEYTPDNMNKRADELLVDKHNEALKVMPVLFGERGYEVTFCEPSYAGYGWIPDLSVFDDCPGVRAFNTEQGQFGQGDQPEQLDETWNRNFFCYSIMKVSPVLIQLSLYQNGSYFRSNAVERIPEQREVDISNAIGQNAAFLNCYGFLCALPEITAVSEGSENTLLLMTNSTTHEPILLQEPGYEPAQVVDNTEYDLANQDRFVLDGKVMHVDSFEQMKHYQSNMAALIKLGEWFDHLRENGVYDNTRIIIVADHGRELKQFNEMITEDGIDVMSYNPLLMVKDFNGGSFITDYSFMTDADVPVIAMNGLINDPVNPFTGKAINNDDKYNTEQLILCTDWHTDINNGTTFLPGQWFSVHDNIFDLSNWKALGKW